MNPWTQRTSNPPSPSRPLSRATQKRRDIGLSVVIKMHRGAQKRRDIGLSAQKRRDIGLSVHIPDIHGDQSNSDSSTGESFMTARDTMLECNNPPVCGGWSIGIGWGRWI
jgi:hypothetical protein